MAPKPQENISNLVVSNDVESKISTGFINNGFEQDLNPLKLGAKCTTDTAASQPIVDFDDLLPHIGEFGKYQKLLFLMMIPFAFFVAFVYFSQIFITLVPDQHWCKIPELEQLGVSERYV